MSKARCPIPSFNMYHQSMTAVKISIDGGINYNWVTSAYLCTRFLLFYILYKRQFYTVPPDRNRRQVNLIEDMIDIQNSWHNAFATYLTVRWDAGNITTQYAQNVDIVLYGYWEDVDGHNLEEVGAIGLNIPNTGALTFTTVSARRLLQRNYQELAVSHIFAPNKENQSSNNRTSGVSTWVV